jgi:hypothetical protein
MICNWHKERTTVSNYKYCLTIYIEQVNFVLQQLCYGVNFSYCSLLSIWITPTSYVLRTTRIANLGKISIVKQGIIDCLVSKMLC